MGSSWWQCAACLRAQEEDICELQLNHCNLYDVPPDVFIYEMTLEKLYLDANRIRDLPRPLFQCHELRVLSLSDNEITTLPPAIASLINLEHLDLSKNSMKELPDNIKECKNLRSIDLSVNPFERFPDALTHIVALRELYLNDAYIEYLPANFGRLSALRTLELRENNMMTLPKSMSRLTNLERLDIGNNDFTELPEVVGDLTNLTELWIDGNDIRRIPGNIEQLYRLNHFDCTMNAVHSLPAEIQGWRDISIMNLSSNEIYQLPDSLCYLRTIVTLKIDDNQLNSLPVDIGQMSSLEELIVTKNFLEYLPSSIGLLRKLHCLNADNNYLRSLPPEIGSCTALSLLSLRSNNINSIPPELGHLSSLTVLNLVNNSIKFLPVSMLNLANLKALWLSDNQSQPLVPLQREFNSEEDMMVLGCFMLPQKQRQQLEQIEQQTVGGISGSMVGTGRKICFAAEVESELPRQLHRAPTPYPKELRNLARHARNLCHQTAQSALDHTMQTERETVIKKAVVTKAATSVLGGVSSVVTGTCSLAQTRPTDKSDKAEKAATNRETRLRKDDVGTNPGTNGEANDGTVIAKESSPEIREAKCVRRNATLEQRGNAATRGTPTIADYVNSTWKPEEYSKTNTAKIVESEKLAEPFKNPSAEALITADRSSSWIGPVGKINQVPPVPPPYHIAAAFSKKAALFRQFDHHQHQHQHHADRSSDSSLSLANSKRDSVSQEHPPLPPPPPPPETRESNGPEGDDRRTIAPMEATTTTTTMMENETRGDSRDASRQVGRPSEGTTTSVVVDNDGECRRSGRKPSRIPILRTKNLEGTWTDEDTREDDDDDDDEERGGRAATDPSDVPISPITGKRYRQSAPSLGSGRSLDRLSKRQTDNGHFVGHCVSREASNSSESYDGVVASTGSVVEGSTLASADLDSLDNAKFDDNNSSNEANSERKTSGRRWMFGQHKNAYVLPVRVRKNPGLGFSIAGGIAGAETGIIVTKVNPEGPAQGALRPGDKILEVDGVDFTKSDHNNAVAVLRSTGPVVAMLVSRHQ